MSKPILNDTSRNWYITAENITTSSTGYNLTMGATGNIFLNSGTSSNGATGIFFNSQSWFDSSSNLNFNFGHGTYENVNSISTDSNSSVIYDTSSLFNVFTYNSSVNKTVVLPTASSCVIGSWIVINNLSNSSSITLKDLSGNIYAILPSITSTSIGGFGVKMLAVSNTYKTGGGFVFV
jgi:hypothetical protein